MPILVDVVSDADLAGAVRLLFSKTTFPAVAARRFHELLATGEFDRRGIFVAKDGETLRGAMFSYLLGGSQAAIWPPIGEDDAIRLALVRGVLDWHREEGTRLVQALVRPIERDRADILLKADFTYVTQLRYFSRELSPLESPAKLQDLHFQRESDVSPDLVQLLLQTYIDSEDIPELNGLRSGEDILAGYRAACGSEQPRWWRIGHASQTVGVLLLSSTDETDTVELTYLGVVPEQRRRGYGRRIVEFAITEAAASNAQSLTLNVDTRNERALRLYRSLGFREFDLHDFFLCQITNSSAK